MRLIGYWDDGTAEWPDPRNFVDPGWDEREREQVADYLERGWVARAYMGRSLCRMCSQPNGSLELSDEPSYGLRVFLTTSANTQSVSRETSSGTSSPSAPR